MSKVLYRWSKKGKPDLCEQTEIVLRTEALCYHCGARIAAGISAVSLLTDRGETYLLHKACADKSCSAVKEKKG